MNKLSLSFVWMFFLQIGFAQLPNGSIAPDFTVTDINGNTHQLYDYLNQGKTVFIDVFAAHCPTCWSYHNQHHFSDLYAAHGLQGAQSDEVRVLAMEFDPNNGLNELNGTGGSTQGNWLLNTPYPVINLEGQARMDWINAYAINYYPLIYAICPDKTIENVGTISSAALYAHSAACPKVTGIEAEANTDFSLYPVPAQNEVFLKGDALSAGDEVAIYTLHGQLLHTQKLENAPYCIDLSTIPQGFYQIKIQTKKGVFSQSLSK